jgi:hypothetical protein
VIVLFAGTFGDVTSATPRLPQALSAAIAAMMPLWTRKVRRPIPSSWAKLATSYPVAALHPRHSGLSLLFNDMLHHSN